MNIVAQNHTWSEQLSSKISCFMEEFHVGKILKACNAYKVRGFSVTSVFQVAFENVFHNKSFYQQEKIGSSVIPFAKDTFYRFMNSSCVNWRKFTLLLGKAVIQKIVPLTSENRRNVLIIDDSLFSRARSKNVELLAKVFDHVEHKYTRGFRMLTLGWSDGNSFLPLSHCLLSSANRENRLQDALFFLAYDELQDLRYPDALVLLLKELIATVKEKTIFMEKELDRILDLFLENLPNLWNKCLKHCA